VTARRMPPPPPPVQAWVERYGAVGVEAPFARLVEGGVHALETALRVPADEREAAWALLAADALLTWAVEEAAGAPDPDRALDAVLRAVVAVRASPTREDGHPHGEAP
jgi:hypothetical protein